MNKWVSVDATNGVAIYTMQLSSDSDTPGHVDGQDFIRVDFDTSDSDIINSYYDFKAKQFFPLPPKPSEDYDFDGQTKQWVCNTQRASQSAIQKRNLLLAQSDYTQLPDVPIENKELWAVYRQDLRDITSQPDFPNVIIWPTSPQGA